MRLADYLNMYTWSQVDLAHEARSLSRRLRERWLAKSSLGAML